MDASNLKPLDFQTLPIQALQPLHAALDPDFNDKQRELLEVIYIGLTNTAAASVCTPQVLAEAAMAVLVQMSHVLGSGAIYVGKLENVRLARLGRAIRANFNGRNHAQLARKYGISEVRVRQILNPTKPKKD
ncbi:MAG: hypothetical protein ABS38_12590 [Acidovorax sp. SCN 68-22]|nr:MAG: hypothetical protein ABS38_12590 [Acidovorax sp. SCN 68-22]